MLEYANSLLAWFLLLGDGGLELWATREAAQTSDPRALAGRIVPLRFGMAILSFGLILLFVVSPLKLFSNFPGLRLLTVLFGLSLFAQAASLKWLWMGREKMARVAGGLVVSQIVFALAVFAFVRRPEAVLWVPVLKLASDSAMAGFFGWLFVKEHGTPALSFEAGNGDAILRPALTIGTSQAMGLLNYNFDTLVLGFLKGASVVGWYNAAYKPVTVALAVPLTYFQGMFPAFSRTWNEQREAFLPLVTKSFRICAILAIPLGVGGMFLAEPVIRLLYGPAFANSVLPFQILVWSAVLVILRGSCRHALNAAGKQSLDLRSAMVSAGLNVGLNLLLIPRYGMVGSAAATLIADTVWLGMACYFFNRAVIRLNPLGVLARPLAAGVAMGALLILTGPAGPFPWVPDEAFVIGVKYLGPWIGRAMLAMVGYVAALVCFREPEILGLLGKRGSS